MFRLNDDKSTLGDRPKHGIKRREEYAQATRQAIVDAARRLFAQRGYFSTKVDDIATLARVAPATVYAVSGGKQGLLRTLMDQVTQDPIVASTILTIENMDAPESIIQVTAETCRVMREDYGDIVRVMLTTAPHDQGVATTLAMATARYRKAFVPIAERLFNLGALHEGLSVAEAVDVFWVYLR